MSNEACKSCKYASLCLSDPSFKRYVVRCTVCGRFRHYNVETETVTELSVPACLSLPRPRKTKCHKCKPGAFHGYIRLVFVKEREAQQVLANMYYVF